MIYTFLKIKFGQGVAYFSSHYVGSFIRTFLTGRFHGFNQLICPIPLNVLPLAHASIRNQYKYYKINVLLNVPWHK